MFFVLRTNHKGNYQSLDILVIKTIYEKKKWNIKRFSECFQTNTLVFRNYIIKH